MALNHREGLRDSEKLVQNPPGKHYVFRKSTGYGLGKDGKGLVSILQCQLEGV